MYKLSCELLGSETASSDEVDCNVYYCRADVDSFDGGGGYCCDSSHCIGLGCRGDGFGRSSNEGGDDNGVLDSCGADVCCGEINGDIVSH
jgi:hypothetical protein